MTSKQLNQIKNFTKKYYQQTDQFHDWTHPLLTIKYAHILAKDYKEVDYKILDASCYLHDIGRVVKDEAHPQESARIAKPYLEEIGLEKNEIQTILNAVVNHAVEDVSQIESMEGKILFDSDKLQILSVYGFIRVYSFLVVVRGWRMKKAIDFMYQYINSVYENHLQTPLAKKILGSEIKKIDDIVRDFKRGISGKL